MPSVYSKPEEPLGVLPRPKENELPLRFFWRYCVSGTTKARLFLGSVALAVCSACNILTPYILGACVDSAHAGAAALGGPLGVGLLGRPQGKRLALAGGIFLLGAIGSACRTEQLERVEEEILTKVKQLVYKCAISSPPSFFAVHTPGHLSGVLSSDCRLLASVLSNSIPSLLRYTNSALGGSLALLLISRRLTASAFLLVPIAGVTAMLIAKRVKRLREARQAAEGRWTECAMNRLYAHRVVYLHQQQQQEIRRAAEVSRQVIAAAAETSRASGLLMGSLSVATNLSLLLVLASGAELVRSGTLSYGSLTSFVVYSLMVGAGFSGLASLSGEFAKAKAAAGRIFSVVQPFLLQQQQQLQEQQQQQQQHFSLEELKGEIEFRNVTYLYDQEANSSSSSSSSSSSTDGPDSPESSSRDSPKSSSSSSTGNGLGVVDVSFCVRPGELLGVAGPSGAGKSTLIKLLAKEIKPQKGVITVDGRDLETIPTALWLRHVLGVVSESSSKLFSGLTLRENIEYGAWGQTADAAAAQAAAAAANCSAFLQQLPQGIETVVGGPGGCSCSSGEQQRLGIARSLYKQPKVLLLDEPSSSLDPESERLFTEALINVMQQQQQQQQLEQQKQKQQHKEQQQHEEQHEDGDKNNNQQQQQHVLSALLIAHSPAVLKAASRLVVLKKGRVVETGMYDELLQQNGTLHALVLGGQN